MAGEEASTGVQSIRRAFDLLQAIADNGGLVSVSTLATASSLPLPTVHRMLKTMVSLGFVQQLPSRQYALGPRLIRLGESAGRSLGASVEPFLVELADRTGETANLAILEGDLVVYVAQAPSKHSMRMFTEIGRRVLPHCTGVGKALLAQLTDDEVREIVRRTGMPARTPATITTYEALITDLDLIRGRGYAEDNSEQEIGVRCIAAAVPGGEVAAAVSISGPGARLTHDAVAEYAPVVRSVAAAIGRTINAVGDVA
jgi:IclR family acetate operon transcriptional repressor